MKITLFVIIIFLLLTPLAAQDGPEFSGKSVGAVGGYTMGFGPAYRYWPGTFGGQVSFSPIITNDLAIISLGTAGFMSLIDTEMVRYFLYTSTSYYYESEPDWGTRHIFALGIGPGVEILLFKRRIGLDVMFGYGGHYNTSGDFQISFTGEGGFFFRY